ncbi:acyl-CoA dehydrogenase [Bradyrhizobium sp. YR681]|uniref:acyl-CoA dehydrogenase family protein n=1 Tax=Bradyrhizobium sp. YR681 TaxID=1144344 RepID=UPI00026F5AAA|nr:acyl-CoA dehydrogenase family protein [Bradyrhizobium sp. YR681]EJN07255.1 acyl-CoA dehydrogenase [Bradyrhizobium sp. YR681]
MFLDISDDQDALLTTVSAVLARAKSRLVLGSGKASFDLELDADLDKNGVLDAASYPEFGVSTAALIVHEVCRSASITEVGASAVIRPLICSDAPRPLAVLTGDPGQAVRFLPVARAVLVLSEAGASWFPVSPDDIEVVDSYFAYPMGRIHDPERCLARSRSVADPMLARRLAQLAVAAEISGVLQGGLDAVVEHVTDRRQFGRPLGTFQSIQHRLAACASKIAAAKWLAFKAGSGSATHADAVTALAYAQTVVDPIVYDLHQFLGAMGLTLEHPLYRWTYRAKLLKSEFGGASRSNRELADLAW